MPKANEFIVVLVMALGFTYLTVELLVDVPTLSPVLLTKDLIRIIMGFILLKKAHSISRDALLLTTIGDF
jgi:hypothetical protein